jgi:hypothetical protein
LRPSDSRQDALARDAGTGVGDRLIRLTRKVQSLGRHPLLFVARTSSLFPAVTQVAFELHITGGIRALRRGGPGFAWSWFPMFRNGQLAELDPRSTAAIASLSQSLGLELFGLDELSGLETPMLARSWRSLDGSDNGGLQPPELWGAIAFNAEEDGDERYAALARNIAFSIHAAGIRLRDASDRYHDQLMAAIDRKAEPGKRFSNIPMRDLQLAFHSVLSELASARDYLATALAFELGAPEKIDAMNRFADWVGAASRLDLQSRPVVSEMLAAYDKSGNDPWLYELTEYRNLFLHRRPLASAAARWLRYDLKDSQPFAYPFIQMPLGAEDPSAPGRDALTRFVGLYRQMVKLLGLAATHSPHDNALPRFVAQ